MITAPTALKDFLDGLASDVDAKAFLADLVTITPRSGTVYRWTTAAFDLTTGGHTFYAGGGGSSPLVRRQSSKRSSKLEVGTFDLWLGGPFTIGGLQLGSLVNTGFFDGASIQVDRCVMPAPADLSLGIIDSWFAGTVAGADPDGVNAILHCKDFLELLNRPLPRFAIRPECGNVVYDANCALSRAAYTLTGSVDSATTSAISTLTAGIVAHVGGYFDLGVLQMTSGSLNGQRRAVAQYVHPTSPPDQPGTFYLSLPFAATPAGGDAFSVYPGCSRTRYVCANTFANLAHYRGFPHLPAPDSGS
jgi:uncharacterized phage protein (TIGR02218 family)